MGSARLPGAQLEGTATLSSPKLLLVASSALFTAEDPPVLCRTHRGREQVGVMELSGDMWPCPVALNPGAHVGREPAARWTVSVH